MPNSKGETEEARAFRLKQMRESQRLLKQKRSKELEQLREEVQVLRQTNSMVLQTLSDYHKLLGVIDICGLSAEQFHYILQFKQHDPSVVDIKEYTPLTVLEDRYRQYEFLFDDGMFLLKFVGKCVIRCLEISKEKGLAYHPSHQNGFKFVPMYGLDLISSFYYQSEKLLNEGLVHNSWLSPNKRLPPNTTDMFGAFDYLVKNFDPDTMLKEVMFGYFARFTYPTAYGPVIYPIDLELTLNICRSARFDEAFLLGTMDSDTCVHDYITYVKKKMEDTDQSEAIKQGAAIFQI